MMIARYAAWATTSKLFRALMNTLNLSPRVVLLLISFNRLIRDI